MDRPTRWMTAVLFGWGVVLSAGPAAAHGPWGRGPLGGRAAEVAADLLDEVEATPAQRETLGRVRDRLVGTLVGLAAAHRGDLDRVLALLAAERIDRPALRAVRDRLEASYRRAAEAVVGALVEVHAALEPRQRRALAGALRELLPEPGERGLGGHLRARFVHRRMERVLSLAHATRAQRELTHAAAQQLRETLSAQGRRADLEQALALLSADRLDRARLAELVRRREEHAHRAADAIEQTLLDVTEAFTAAQRRAVVEHVRERVARHRG